MAADVTATFAAKDESFAATVNRLQQTLTGFGQNVQSFNTEFANLAEGFKSAATKTASLVLGFIGVSSAFDALKKSFNKAAEFQDMERRFAILLGSTAAAKERMNELSDFMDRTPFELPGIIAANITLQNLTGGALATTQGMTQVGDAASALGVPFDEMAQLIGRVYNALEAGAPIGKYSSRLLELGAITPQTKQQLDELKDEVNEGKTSWSLIETELSKFTGSMKSQSTTWNATMSGFSDAVDEAMRAFAAPLLPPLTNALQKTADVVRADLAPSIERAMSAFTTDWLPGVLNAFSDIRGAGTAFNNLMMAGAIEFANLTYDTLSQAFRSVVLGFQNVMSTAIDGLSGMLKNVWTAAMDVVILGFQQSLLGALNLVSGIIPGAAAAAARIAQQVEASASRIEVSMQQSKFEGNKVLDAFKEGAGKAEFIEHRLLDSSKYADAVAQYLQDAAEKGAVPVEAEMGNAADHAKTAAEQYAEARESAKAIRQATFDSTQFAKRYKEFFAEAETEMGKIRKQSGETEESGDGFREQIKDAYPFMGDIKRAAKETEDHGFGFAQNVKDAKLDAGKIYSMFVGPDSLIGKFNDSMQKTNQLKGAIESLDASTKQASEARAYDRQMDSAARAYERALQRAESQRERGLHSSAENTMRNAREQYTKSELQSRYEMSSKILLEQDMQAAKQAKTFAERIKQEQQALKNHKERMTESANYVKNQMQSAADSVSGAMNTAAQHFFNAGAAGQQAGAAIQGATNALNQLVGSISAQNTQLALEATLQQCRSFLESIDEKLPQNSLS